MNIDPHLEVIVGTMFVGKTTELIRRIRRYEVSGKKVQAYKPAIDDRYSKNHASTHDGLQLEVLHVEGMGELRRHYEGYFEKYKKRIDVVGVDEAQFLESSVLDFLEEHVRHGGIGVASVLLKDYKDKFFTFKDGRGDTSEFIRRADHVLYLKALCTYKESEGTICGSDATRVQRFIEGKIDSPDSDLVLVGGKESYAPRCRKHYVFYE